MRFYFLLILISTTGLSFAQDSTHIKSYGSVLSLGEALEFEDKSVAFKKVVSDSRCPQNVTCIWAGEARILVEVFERGKSCGTELLTLTAGAKLPKFLHQFFPNQNVALSGLILSPYPVAGQEIEASQYTLDLEVNIQESPEK